MKKFFKNIKDNKTLLLMTLPGAVWFILFFYIPVFGNVVAFKDLRLHEQGFINSLINSEWVGLDNFKFLFESQSAYIMTRNTVLYNVSFIIIGTVAAVTVAIIMSMLRDKRKVKVYQTSMLFPYFLSWVIISFFVYSFLSPDKGAVNRFLLSAGLEKVNWYNDRRWWPYIIPAIAVWKSLGYDSILYFATIMGIDPTYYEAAIIDGASRWQQVKHVTIPQLKPMIVILLILAVGSMFSADFGLFYHVPRNSGPLTSVTMVIDTYVYKGLATSGDIGMSAAAGLYQSVVGSILLISTNFIAGKIDPESGLF